MGIKRFISCLLDKNKMKIHFIFKLNFYFFFINIKTKLFDWKTQILWQFYNLLFILPWQKTKKITLKENSWIKIIFNIIQWTKQKVEEFSINLVKEKKSFKLYSMMLWKLFSSSSSSSTWLDTTSIRSIELITSDYSTA